jgi:hypothetical protein
VNSGRLAEPAVYRVPTGPGRSVNHVGAVAPDAPLPAGGRLRERLGRGWVLVIPAGHRHRPERAEAVEVGPGTAYGADRAWLVRPDGHVAASLPLEETTPAALDGLVMAAMP